MPELNPNTNNDRPEMMKNMAISVLESDLMVSLCLPTEESACSYQQNHAHPHSLFSRIIIPPCLYEIPDVMSHINRFVSCTSMFFDGLESFGVHIILGVSTISANVSDLSCDSPRRNNNCSPLSPRPILIIPNPCTSTLGATF